MLRVLGPYTWGGSVGGLLGASPGGDNQNLKTGCGVGR